MKSSIAIAITAAAALLTAGTAQGATFSYIEVPALIGAGPGPDFSWDTGDEGPALNTLGGATPFSDTLGNFGFTVGSFETNGGAANVFGLNTITSSTTGGKYSNPGFAIVDEDFSQSLDPGVLAPLIIEADHSVTGSAVLDHFTPSFGPAKLSIGALSGTWITPGDDPVAVFGAGTPELANFLFLEPLLPTPGLPGGWTMFMSVVQGFEFLGVGITGTQIGNIFSVDPGAAPIPLPAALPMALSGSVALFGLVSRRRTRT